MIRYGHAATIACAVLAGSGLVLSERAVAAGVPGYAEHQRQCAGKEGWSDPAPPLRIFGNVYDVGTCGIVVLLVTGPEGHILIDAAPADAADQVIANVERLGFRRRDIKLLLSSHEHVDHAGGLNALRRRTGARMIATAAARPGLASGVAQPDDPQRAGLPPFSGVPVDRIVRDGEVIRLGPLSLTAHATPGHSPGSTSWSWRSCVRRNCRSIVYADSLSAVTAGNYRFADHPAYVATFRSSIDKIAALPCDVLITPHPAASGLYERLAGSKPLIDRTGCVAYAAAARAKLREKVAEQGL